MSKTAAVFNKKKFINEVTETVRQRVDDAERLLLREIEWPQMRSKSSPPRSSSITM